jgi:predicted metal-binding membrane protein
MIAAKRVNLVTGGILLALAAAAWYVTIATLGPMAMMEVSVPIYLATWLTMLVAMMFPAVAPVVAAFARVANARQDASLTVPAFVAGYLVIWIAAGLVPLTLYLLSRGMVAGMSSSPAGAVVIGAVLFGAGIYQFTPWKGTCLRACRSALGVVMNHDFGTGIAGAFRAGAAHGAFCLGCCWALMAVLVLIGIMSLAWMAIMSIVFLGEKNWRYGVELTRVAGTLITLLGIAIIVDPQVLAVLPGGILPSAG